jgi:hypothetical protein
MNQFELFALTQSGGVVMLSKWVMNIFQYVTCMSQHYCIPTSTINVFRVFLRLNRMNWDFEFYYCFHQLLSEAYRCTRHDFHIHWQTLAYFCAKQSQNDQ